MLLRCLAASLLICLAVGCRRAPSGTGPDPQVVDLMNRGVSWMGQYDYAQAADAFEAAVRLDPQLADARVNLAMAVFNRGHKEDMDRTVALLDEVLAKDAAHLRALYFKGIVLQHLGNAEAAVPCFETVTRARPDDGVAWYLLGLCRQRVGQPSEAELLHAVRLRPHLYSAYYQLYQSMLRAGEVDKAKAYLEQFRTLRESPLGESVELPQYNQMGELALALPLPAQRPSPIARSRYRPGAAQSLGQVPGAASHAAGVPGGLALGDLNGDGRLDVAFTAGASGDLALWLGNTRGGFTDATVTAGVAHLQQVRSCSLGDVDNDGFPDLFVATANRQVLLRGSTNGTFTELALASAPGGFGLFLDADHDGDLDVLVGNAASTTQTGGPSRALWNNNGDGTFTNLATGTDLAGASHPTVQVLPGDLDDDRDMDLVVLREGAGAQVFLNQLFGRFAETATSDPAIRGDLGGVLQDFNGDGALDLVVLGGDPPQLALFLGDGWGRFRPADGFADPARAIRTFGPTRAVRAADLDLDGDLDIAVFGDEGHTLLNDGTGRFVVQGRVWRPSAGAHWSALELLDATGDGVPDLLALESGTDFQLKLAAGELTPPASAVQVAPTGIRSRDNRTRSPASGFGVKLTARAALREYSRVYHGLHGSASQSLVPVVFGLDAAPRLDYLNLLWPDGVAQVETALAAGPPHRIPEIQRKISSCPVLFTWNGERFEFVTDFAGVGGLGYFVSPGVSAPPQVLEHVKIAPGQLQSRNGRYELRVTEPMEESAYVDRLELVAVDHPADQSVFPDERLALSGPAPTHELLVVEDPIFPAQARAPDGLDCTERLRHIDRTYAYEPPLDRRYLGFCRPHALELDFADRLAGVGPNDRVYLFLNGFIEYPYSQTVFAAGQSRLGWEPIRVELLGDDGRWHTVVPDGGAPGGMARTFTIELTGLVTGPRCALRLTTNLEIYLDQVFVSRHAGMDRVQQTSVPLRSAELRRVGFAREYSPDGRLPLIYDYERSDASAPFHVLRGAYTRYGPVEPLLADFDDRYVVVGPGDEIALSFDATALPEPQPGQVRSFLLLSHAYCKDMDLYTATPRTLEPLPFRAMSRYPYPDTEQFPDTPELRASRAEYNTRIIE